MAYHPGLRLAYIPVVDVPSLVTYRGDGDYDDRLQPVTELDGQPFSPGKLVAWDPVTQSARWQVGREYPFNGGVLTTAGNLVFQGDALGAFEAYAADTGRLLWRMVTGTAITAAPVSYSAHGRQHVLIPVGAGGAAQFLYPALHALDRPQGPTRLLAFRLGGTAHLPPAAVTTHELPEQPKFPTTEESIEQGQTLFAKLCSYCHGDRAVARHGGSVPDLRYASAATLEEWHAIVIGGARRMNGMPPSALTIAESKAIRNYVLSLSATLRRAPSPR
jgi:quinohemoprotein ethanol dehydrogenase